MKKVGCDFPSQRCFDCGRKNICKWWKQKKAYLKEEEKVFVKTSRRYVRD